MAVTLALASACLRPRPPPPPPIEPPPRVPVLESEHVEPELIEPLRHRVQQGETAYRISRMYGLTPEELLQANGISDPRLLAVGQELVIPGAEPAPASGMFGPAPPPPKEPSKEPPQEEPREAPAPASSRVPLQPVTVRPAERSRAPDVDPHEPIGQPRPAPEKKAPATPPRPPLRSGALKWPLRGVLYARFGKKGKEPHDGIDLAAPAGASVMTAAEGTVLFAGEQKGYGQIVIVQHDQGLITLYAHNRDVRVKTGQKVREGQVVATVGESGRTSGPHLHFEVRKDGVPVDPLDYLGPVPPR
jgi:lipoprotein NlpD